MPKRKREPTKKAPKNDTSKPNYKSAPIAIEPESLEVKIREKDIFEHRETTGGKKRKTR